MVREQKISSRTTPFILCSITRLVSLQRCVSSIVNKGMRGMIPRSRLRYPLMLMALVTLLAALWAGLLRIGWHIPALRPTLAQVHGPLMVAGFLGTLVSLERAVALGHRSAYAAPFLTGLGGLLLVVGVTGWPGPLLITLGSCALIIIFAVIIHRHPGMPTMVMEIGALVWFVGNVLWLVGWPIFHIVPWWGGFLILTIAGERLELGRLRQPSRGAQVSFVLILVCYLGGLVSSVIAADVGQRIAGFGALGLAFWLMRYDIARRTIHRPGLTRFIAVCMLSGYVWLGISGVLSVIFGSVPAGPYYDALLHTLFLGFVFAMIFGHAPIIVPAILGRPMAYFRGFYAHLLVLHGSLLLRIVGDLVGWGEGRRWGGLLNEVALLLFLASTVWAIRGSIKTAKVCTPKHASSSAPH